MSEPFIRARGLEYTYMAGTPLEVRALKGVDLEVWPGEAVGIIGPAGAGKSTLVQHLNGLLRPQALGQLWIDGEDLGDPRLDARPLRRKIGLVFQRPEDQLFKTLVGDDVAFGPRQLGLSRAEVRERVQWAMEMVGLDFQAFVDRPTVSLSGGERRRAAIAGTLALRPSTLILDEATSGLDPRGRRQLLELLGRLHREQGTTVILVTSYMEDLVGLAERAVVLADGRTVLQGSLRDVYGQAELLRSHGLGVPQMAEVAEALAARGLRLGRVPLSVQEAEEEIAPRLGVGCGVV
ncbi:MAG: energy-coupling factor transporter ATPase [Anaerolineae bacterium]|nr:energy-coupling factor transporter ATPase [Anaerolineae bacterium]